MRACRSIAHLEAFFPYPTFENDHFNCNICKEYLQNITLKQKFLPISYDPSHGTEFSSQNKLSSQLDCTGRPSPVVVSADKMTEKRQTGQMTAIAYVCPKAPPDQIVQTKFLKNPIVKAHDAKGIMLSIAKELKEILPEENIPTQMIGGGFDGQYFKMGVTTQFIKELGLEKSFFYWDPSHRLNLSDKDVQEMCSFYIIFITKGGFHDQDEFFSSKSKAKQFSI
jgi:hypothetical protein